MVAQGSCSIVNITSVNGLAMSGNEAYSAAKVASSASPTRSPCATGPRGVRCDAITPGTIRTPAWEGRKRRDPEVMERMAQWCPMGPGGESDDVAGPGLFLASDDAA
jgi:NAD(P)-dependent dehydrogenase (short-subunit alcohol dehydrogenase family)